MSKQFKGIIFDMDGTMIDNMMVHHHAWKRKLGSLGLDMSLEEIMEKVHGINEEIIERLFGDRFSPAERKTISAEKEEEYRKIFLPQLKLIEGLSDLLDDLTLRKVPMAVGTAAPPKNVEFVVDNLKLAPYFKGIFHSRSVKKGKPDPEIFEMAAESMGLESQDCLVFEDSLTGVETALNAGTQAVVVTTTHQEEEFAHFPNVLFYIKSYKDPRLLSFLSDQFS
ncbi:MAG: HAD family phosphatase [Bacteroidota bacterium]